VRERKGKVPHIRLVLFNITFNYAVLIAQTAIIQL
jgi:hypothetical protein